MTDNKSELQQTPGMKNLFQKHLNRHGYSFQYAVIRTAQELHENEGSRWVFEASEFPVAVQGYNTCIDFIMSYCPGGGAYGYLVSECKRANPSLSNWLFAKAPYVRRGQSSPVVLVESARRYGRDLFSRVDKLPTKGEIYNIALEAKSQLKGDVAGTRGAIEDAATQVTRGVNGLIQCLSNNLQILEDNSPPSFFVPVIFTTAKLWITNADLGEADVTSGDVNLDNAKVEESPWLWLQYHVSPTLKHSIDREGSNRDDRYKDTFGYLLTQEYARTIAIVGTDGIDSFLRQSSHWWD